MKHQLMMWSQQVCRLLSGGEIIMLNILFIIFSPLNTPNKREPARLNKKENGVTLKLIRENKNKVDEYCTRICPYILVTCVIIISVLSFVALAKYGRLWFSTPENHYEHLTQIVGCIL